MVKRFKQSHLGLNTFDIFREYLLSQNDNCTIFHFQNIAHTFTKTQLYYYAVRFEESKIFGLRR